jgi:hypothetical protein
MGQQIKAKALPKARNGRSFSKKIIKIGKIANSMVLLNSLEHNVVDLQS